MSSENGMTESGKLCDNNAGTCDVEPSETDYDAAAADHSAADVSDLYAKLDQLFNGDSNATLRASELLRRMLARFEERARRVAWARHRDSIDADEDGERFDFCEQ